MAADGHRSPRVAGWPVEPRTVPVGSLSVEILTVAGLEGLLDRDRLLRDEALEPPYWALLWSGSVLLAERLAEGGCAGRRLLDVGCGLGLVALTGARLGASVTAVDLDPDAIAFVRESAARARLEVRAVAGDVAHLRDVWDVVTAAELLYDRPGFPELAGSLARLLAPGGVLWVADAFRVDTREFYDELDALGLACVEERVRSVDEEGTRVRVRIAAYRFPSSDRCSREPGP